MNFKLLIHLITGIFSLNPKNMRWFNIKRILVVIILLPIFLLLLVTNRLFLILDNLFFPFFRNQKMIEAVFIISMPRTATTYLFHKLAEHKEEFTCFKLWEIIFAPSITQKYIYLFILRIDRVFYSPIVKSINFIEEKLLNNLKSIHLIGLRYPEEDEAILLWDLASPYLNFFYPDNNFFDDYFNFDNSLNEKHRKFVMNRYLSYVKRHNYVFNRNNEKHYLSKNPLFMSKIKSIYEYFPDSKILQINRCPKDTIPSTIRLNNTLYSFFTSKKVTEELNEKTVTFLINWYKHANKCLTTFYKNQSFTIGFKDLISDKQSELQKMSDFLDIELDLISFSNIEVSKQHKSKKNYTSFNDKEMEQILNKIPFTKSFCD